MAPFFSKTASASALADTNFSNVYSGRKKLTFKCRAFATKFSRKK